MTTAQTLIHQCRREHLHSRDQMNRLTTTLNTTDTTVTVDFDLTGISRDSIIGIDTELMYVWDVPVGTRNLTVQRGHGGSVAAAHTAGAIVRVNPRVSDFDILAAFNDELRALSARGVWRMRTVDLTSNASNAGYDLTGLTSADVVDVWEVRYKQPGATGDWPVLSGWTLARDLPTSDFASGMALMTSQAPYPGQTVRVRYISTLGLLTAATDDVETVTGIPGTAIDLLPLGAAISLTAGRGAARTDMRAQGDTRRAEEVSAGDTIQGISALRARYQQRVTEEARRLRRRYKTRLR